MGRGLLRHVWHIKMEINTALLILISVAWFQVRTAFFEGRNRADSIVSDIYDWGASAITVHGRSRQQRYSKLADWDYIYQCAQKAPDQLHVVGNGDVFSFTDWNKHVSGCSKISTCMIARGALIKVSLVLQYMYYNIYQEKNAIIASCNVRLLFPQIHVC